MKRILILLLALIMCLGCFFACDKNPAGSEDTTVEDTAATEATLTDAVKYLRSIYKDSAKETPADYDVVGKVVIGTTEFAVTWTTDNANITVKVSEKNAAFYTIDLPVKNEAAVDYKLTATVTDAAGQSESVTFDRALPVYDSSAIVDKPEEGVAYKFYMIHASLGQTLFATGETQDGGNKYILSTTDPKAAPDFFVEADGEGFKFYTELNGVKTYIYAKTTTSDDGKVSKYVGYSTEQGTTWTYKSETNGWYATIEGVEYVVGTYGTYNTFCISESTHLTVENSGKTQFPGGLMLKDVAEAMTPSAGPTIYETPEEIVNAVYDLEIGGVLSGGHKYTLTGVITSIPTAWSDDYGNITVIIVVGDMTDKPIECFRLKGEGANTLAVGDTITVTGELLKYNNNTETGKVEFNAGCTLDSGNGSGNGGNNGGNDTPAVKPEASLSVSAPTADGVYKLYLVQVTTGKVLFANGLTDNDKFLKASEKATEGLDFHAEAVDGGYKFYTEIGGAKKYLHAYTTTDDAGKVSKFLCYADTTDAVWSYKAETNAWYVTLNALEYVAGTYNSFDTFSISDSKFMTSATTGVSQFPLNLVEKAVAEADDFADKLNGSDNGGSDDNGGNTDTPSTSEGLQAQSPVAGTAYKLGFLQGNKNQIFYLTGELSGYYMASTETFASGADFYVEATNGGYYLYCMVGGAKKYVNMVVSGSYVNGKFEDAAASVYTYDETLKTLVSVVNGTNYIYGTRSDGTYTTLGPMKADSGCFYAVLVTEAGNLPSGGDEGNDTPDTPTTPSTPSGEGVSEVKVDTPYYIFSTCGSGTNYFSGTLKSGRIDGTTSKASAVSIKLEAGANAGEYYIYFMDGSTKTYIGVNSAASSKTAAFTFVTTKDDTCVWLIDTTAKTIISKAFSGRGIATQVASQYTNFSTYASSNFGTADYQTAWFLAA